VIFEKLFYKLHFTNVNKIGVSYFSGE